ncbi:hypothetical protein M5K25_017846 [Dendrobium thyrsiflorum]|uniref:Uncharacterized protein n=1 Tax=Dendrobium thyrsiflorum TaxID=117978 RepID=A0ABD0UGP3_DENTH
MRAKSLGSVLSTTSSAFQNLPRNIIPLKLPPKKKADGGRGRIFEAHTLTLTPPKSKPKLSLVSYLGRPPSPSLLLGFLGETSFSQKESSRTAKSVIHSTSTPRVLCMVDPERDSGVVYNEQGFFDILRSPFFDVNPEACKFRLGDLRGSLLDTEIALRENASNAKALFRQGQAHMALNDIDAASKSFRKALELEPNDGGIKRELATTKKKIADRLHQEKKAYAKMFQQKSGKP